MSVHSPSTRAPLARAFVVAGGRSSRMGRDKARLGYGGSTLLEHAVGLLRGVTPDVAVLCGPTRRYEEFGVPVVADEVCGAGPLSGLYSALVSASSEHRAQVLWLGVDLPLVPATFLAGLLQGLETTEVTMARSSHGPEPLCAAFQSEAALTVVRRALLHGQLKLSSALDGLEIRFLDGEDGFFANVNSPAEYKRLPPRGQARR